MLRYDDLDRLTSAAGGYGSYTYTYDSAGNRLSQAGGGISTAYSYAARSNQLTRVTTNAGSQSLGYDKGGRFGNSVKHLVHLVRLVCFDA
jgi:YD repeat-containing protein